MMRYIQTVHVDNISLTSVLKLLKSIETIEIKQQRIDLVNLAMDDTSLL